MLAFYVSTGAALLLFVAFHFAWTPLRVWYWEREVRKTPWLGLMEETRLEAAEKLAGMGPQAAPAFRRLLSDRCHAALAGFRQPDDAWALSLIAQAARSPDASMVVQAAYAAERVSGRSFVKESDWLVEKAGPELPGLHGKLLKSLPKKSQEEIAARVLAWCEEEGRTTREGAVE